MAAAALKSRDWSGLFHDLLQDIAGRLTEIPDRIRFRCVCVRWRSAAESIATPTPQLPWLLLPIESDPIPTKQKRRFWSFAENRIYDLPFIGSIQSSHVWITKVAASTCSMPLPPWTPPLPDKYRGLDVAKAKISSPSSLVAIMLDIAILFCRPGDTAWKEIPTPYFEPLGSSCLDGNGDFALHGNRVFILRTPIKYRSTSVVSIIDMNDVQERWRYRMPPPNVCDLRRRKYLVETPFGELLLVFRVERDAGGDGSKMFHLFRLDESKLKWRKISGIGDNVLFLGRNQAIALDARGLTCCKRNCIYFVDLHKTVVLLFDIDKGLIEEAPIFEVDVSSPSEWQHGNWMVPTIS